MVALDRVDCCCPSLVALDHGAATGLAAVLTSAGSGAIVGFSHGDVGCRSVAKAVLGSLEGTGCSRLLGTALGVDVLLTGVDHSVGGV